MTLSLRSVGFALLGLSLIACGGNVDDDGTAPPNAPAVAPAVDTRFTLQIDDQKIDLAAPSGTRFVQPDGSSYVSLTAREARTGGDYIRAASMLLSEPLALGTHDCTPDADGRVSTGVSLTPGDFFGFKATLTDCKVTVTYLASDRIVGTFSVDGHAPDGSSLDGTVSKATGSFDVPVGKP